MRMKPKHLLLANSFMLFALVTLGQKNFDRVILKSGKTYKGTVITQDSTNILFRTDEMSGLYQTFKIEKKYIDKLIPNLTENTDTIKPLSNIRNYPETTRKIDLRIKDTGFHLKRGGRFGIAGVSFLVVGSIFEAVGIVKGIPGLTYTGVAMSGLGGIFLIVPFGQMIRAGNKYPKADN